MHPVYSSIHTAIRRFRTLADRFIVVPSKLLLAAAKHAVITYPVAAFAVTMTTLLVLIITGNVLRRPRQETVTTDIRVKKVRTYTIGSAPKILLEGKIEKTGTVTVVAITGGIVKSVNVKPGDAVKRKGSLVSLSSNYSGANAASVQRQIAAANYDQIHDTFDIQVEIIDKQKETAEKTGENSDRMRELTREANEATRSQLSLSRDILNSVNENLTALEEATPSAENEALVLSTKQLKSQYQNAVGQLENTIAQSEYQGSDEEIPAQLATLQKDIAIRQLDVQKRSLELSKEVALLNLRLSQINESLYFPTSPFAGTVEKVHVREGQFVSPGTPLVTISGSTGSLNAVSLADARVARNISKLEPGTLFLSGAAVEVKPSYISGEPTDGRLFSVYFPIPDEYADRVSDREYVLIEVSIGYPETGSILPYIPLDSVHQTQDFAYVFTLKDSTVDSRQVKLGPVFGKYVQVTEGLTTDDTVILDRTVVTGSKAERL